MNHETSPDPATVQADVTTEHKLHRDYETRGRADLRKVGAAVYAADPTTEVICIAYAVDDGPVQRWFPGDPVPPVWFEAAANPNWTAIAHNDPFEAQIETNILHPKHGFPLIPPDRHRCSQAVSVSLGLPAKLGLLADALEFTNRKDAGGERLMHRMTKPRKPRKNEDPDRIYWHEDPDQIERLSDYNCLDVDCEREADSLLLSLPDSEQQVWQLSNRINERGFHVDRKFAEAARKIAEAAAPEIDAELAELTAGAVTKIGQVQKIKDWLRTQGCETSSLDSDTIETLLEDENLAVPVRRVLEIRAGGAQAAVKKIDALLAHAGSDDRVRGAFRYHGASTGRWSGEGVQPQNLKRPETKDLDAAISAVATGDYQLMKRLYSKPLAIVGDVTRQMITAANGHELIGADLSAIESRVLAMVAGEEWKLENYRRFDSSHDPRDEPYCATACKIFGVPDGTYDKNLPERGVGKICDLAFGYAGGLGAWRNFSDNFTDAEVEVFKNDWRASHPAIEQFWYDVDRAAVRAVHKPGTAFKCGPVVLESDGKFLKVRLPSGRNLSYPNPRLIVDDRNKARVVYDDNSGGRFAACRAGFGAYGGTWAENIISGIARDILVEAMLRIEAAGYAIVMHIHDEVVCEVPVGFGSEQEFLDLLTQRPAWAPDLPIAASAWRGLRYDKTGPPSKQPQSPAECGPEMTTMMDSTETFDADYVEVEDNHPKPQPLEADNPVSTTTPDPVVSASFSRFEAHRERLSKLYELGAGGKVIKIGGTQMGSGEYETITIKAANPPAVLAEIGNKIDGLNFREAIGLGVVRGNLPLAGDITTKGKYEKRKAGTHATAIPRALSHFGWPGGCGVLLFDGDDKDDLAQILVALYPEFADVAALVRPSASASVKDPATGERLKPGEHLFTLIDEPIKSKDCLQAVLRLAWCVGAGHSAGWLGLAKDGDPQVYGPVDVTVGSPERLVYEGEVSLGKGLERLPRISSVFGGNNVLCASALIAYADQHAPAKRFDELVAAAKAEPAFLAKQAAIKSAYRADHIEKAVARGGVREGSGTRIRPRSPGRKRPLLEGGSGASCHHTRRCTGPTARRSPRPTWRPTRRRFIKRNAVIRSRAWTTRRAIAGSSFIRAGGSRSILAHTAIVMHTSCRCSMRTIPALPRVSALVVAAAVVVVLARSQQARVVPVPAASQGSSARPSRSSNMGRCR